LIYLDPDPGDEILVSPLTDMGTVIPILYQQAVPVFVDIDPRIQNMDPRKIEENISDRTRAIIVTHLHGIPADMDPIMEIAGRHDLFIIEDAAQAHMAEYHGKYVGAVGNIGCFSLQQSKHITTGDGGMLITDEDNRFGRSLRLCFDKGWPRNEPVRDHYFLAPNYHMTELQAAVGLAQLRKYGQSLQARKQSAKEMLGRLADFDLVFPLETYPSTSSTFFAYAFRLNMGKLRVNGEKIVEALQSEGLPCELGYPGTIPLYLYPMIKERKTFGRSGWPFDSPAARKTWRYELGLCPEAEKACRETVVVPWNEGLRSEHVQLISEAIVKVLEYYRIK
jgi:perosamine synthetase